MFPMVILKSDGIEYELPYVKEKKKKKKNKLPEIKTIDIKDNWLTWESPATPPPMYLKKHHSRRKWGSKSKQTSEVLTGWDSPPTPVIPSSIGWDP
jgi:hypothetical protein